MTTTFDPNLLDFAASKKASGFSRQNTSLRSTGAVEPQVTFADQPPLDLSTLQSRLAQAEVAADQETCAYLYKQRRMLKSKLRLETLKNLKDLLHGLVQRLQQAASDALHDQVLSAGQSLQALYQAELKPSPKEGEIPLRQFVAFCQQKCNALLAAATHCQALLHAEDKQQQLLKKALPVTPMEKAGLIEISLLINRYLQLWLQSQTAGSAAPPATAPETPAEPLQDSAHQLEAQLYHLQQQLGRAPSEAERQLLQQNIKRIQDLLQQQSSVKRALQLKRYERSFGNHLERLQSLVSKIETAPYARVLKYIHMQQQKYLQLCHKDLQQLLQMYQQAQLGFQTLEAYLQAWNSCFVGLAQQADSLVPAAPEAIAEMAEAERDFFDNLHLVLARWCSTYQQQVQLLQTQTEWLSTQERLLALDELEQRLLGQDTELDALELALDASDLAGVEALSQQWLEQQMLSLAAVQTFQQPARAGLTTTFNKREG